MERLFLDLLERSFCKNRHFCVETGNNSIFALGKSFLRYLVSFFPLPLTGNTNIARVLANNNITMCTDLAFLNSLLSYLCQKGFYHKYISSIAIT